MRRCYIFERVESFYNCCERFANGRAKGGNPKAKRRNALALRGSPYRVIVCDLFNLHEPDHEVVIEGFPNREVAVEYARRRTWGSVEQMREAGLSAEQLRNRWLALGEDCRVVGPEGVVYVARSELDRFLRHPLPPERGDWVGLYRSGSVPPPYHYEYVLSVSSREKGRLRFWPDYPAQGCPLWEATFVPHLTACILLHNWARATGLFARKPPAAEASTEAIGGESGVLTLSAGGQHGQVAVHRLAADERLQVHQALRSIVPPRVWADCEGKRRRYIAARYPEAEG